MVRNQIDRWWNKVEQRHERSGIGSLMRPEDIYLRPEVLRATLESHMGLDLDQLGAVDVLEEDTTLGEIELPTRPTLRFHGSIPALTEQLKTLMKTETRIVLAAPHQGDVERMATVLREYHVPYRLGSRAQRPGETMLDEGSYLAGDLRVPVIVRTPLAAGVGFTESNLIVFGANDLSDEADVAARPEPKRSKTAAFVSDFRDLGSRRLRGACGAWHCAVPGTERDCAGRALSRVHDPGVRRSCQALCSADAAGFDSEIPLHRRGTRAGAEPAGLAAVGQDQGARAQGHAGHGRANC